MLRSLQVSLADLQQYLVELDSFVTGKTLADYQRDTLLRRGVERNFTIIGEIMSRIIHQFPEAKDRIENARKVADFRNFLIHEYHHVKDEDVWSILQHSSPILKQQVDIWLAELDAR